MALKLAVVVCVVLVSLQLGVHAHHNALESSHLAHHTHEAQRSLDSLPSHCTAGTTELILAEESRVATIIKSCSKRTILGHLSELIVDTDYFGIDLFKNGMTLYSDWKLCSSQTVLFERLICVLDKSSGAVRAVFELATGAFSYLLETANLVPKIRSEIKECRKAQETEYQLFLEGVVRKATMC